MNNRYFIKKYQAAASFFSEKLVWDQFLFHRLLRFVVIQDMTDLEIIAESPCAYPSALYVFIDCTAKKEREENWHTIFKLLQFVRRIIA